MTVDEFIAERVGQVVGDRWMLDRVLGAGGMAAVYAAHDSAGRVAAVKILHPEMSVRRDVRERFLREGVAASRIDHPGVVAVYERGTREDDGAFLVMELLEGETLGERLQRHGTLPVPQVLDVMNQVLDVLAVAHDRGIVHRDLKPDNLFITNGESVKVLDFGLARLLDAVPGDFKTRTGAALGTFPYMAPEQALGRRAEIDGRVDLFSLGATAFRILAQRKVHEADSDAELLMAMASKAAPPLRVVAPHVPDPVARVVDVSLAFAKEARYPDARTMQIDVRAAMEGQPPPFASARQRAQGAPTSVGGHPAEVAAGSGAVFGSAATHVTEPLGTRAGAAPGGTQLSVSVPASVPGAYQSSEPTAPLSGPVGSVPPVSGTAHTASPASAASGTKRGRARSAAALIVGLTTVSILVLVLMAGGAFLVWWWRGGPAGVAPADRAEAEGEGASAQTPPPADPDPDNVAVTEAPARLEDGDGTASLAPAEATVQGPMPEASTREAVGPTAEKPRETTPTDQADAEESFAPDPKAPGSAQTTVPSSAPSAAATVPAPPPPPPRTGRPRGKPPGAGRSRRKKDDG